MYEASSEYLEVQETSFFIWRFRRQILRCRRQAFDILRCSVSKGAGGNQLVSGVGCKHWVCGGAGSKQFASGTSGGDLEL